MDLAKRIWRSLWRPRKLADRVQLLLDLWRFRWRYGFLRAHGAQSQRAMLIVSLTDWVPQVKMEGMLGKILQLRDVTPVVLTWRSCVQAQLFFRCFGFDRFLFLDDLMAATEAEIDPNLPKDILRKLQSFRSLLDWTYRDIRVGNHVLSTAVRRLRQGSGSFMDPQVQHLLSDLLPRSLRTVHATEQLFSQLRPNIVLFLEKGYSPYGEVFDAAVKRDIPCVQFVHSQRNDALVLKRYTMANRTQHPFSLSPTTWQRVKEMSWTAKQEHTFMEELRRSYEQGTWFNRKFLLEGKKVKSPDEVRAQLGLDPRKKTAVIFSHVLWDATFFFGTTHFDDYEHWLVESVKVACKNDSVNWIIKLHPDYVWKMKQMGDTGDPRDIVALQANIGTLPPHVHVVLPQTDISTYSFFAVTDWCITVRGTIGIEAPCFGIPVITAGTGRYSGLGFTNDSETREEYLRKLERIQDIPPLTDAETRLARLHAHALFDLRPLPFHTFEMTKTTLAQSGRALGYNVVIRASSLDDIRNAEDMNTFADWVLHASEEDYLHLAQ